MDEEEFRRLYFALPIARRVSIERRLLERFPLPTPPDWWAQLSERERAELAADVRG